MRIHSGEMIRFVRVHRIPLGPRNPINAKNARPHLMIAKFQYYQDRELVWSSRKNLKDKPYHLDENTCKELSIMFAQRKNENRTNIAIVFDKRFVNSTTYTIQQLHKLPINHKLRPENVATPAIGEEIVAFFSGASPLFNFHISKTNIDSVTYHSNKQFLKASEAQ